MASVTIVAWAAFPRAVRTEKAIPPKADPKAIPENRKDEDKARARPRKPDSSSTIRRCCEGQTMSQTKGHAASAANTMAREAGSTNRAAKIAITVSIASPERGLRRPGGRGRSDPGPLPGTAPWVP